MKKVVIKLGLLQMPLLLASVMSYAQKKDSIKTSSIDEVVVTAYGVKKEKKALGYSFQDVKGQALVDAKEVNVTNALVGKVAGLQIIKGNNGPASSSKINIRGFNSLKGDNQPLIVVDGVPMSNAAGNKSKNNLQDKNNDMWIPDMDMGNGLSDINPEDIESISVLKGGAASALYGSRAGNGVILITTKTGKKKGGGVGVTYSTSMGFENMFIKPDLQSSFGRGTDGGDYPAGSQDTGSWGAPIQGQVYDNLKNFFRVGSNVQHSLTFQENLGAGTNLYTSATYLSNNSQIPNSKYERWNFMAKMSSNFGENKRWTSDVKFQYISARANNRPISGMADGGNLYPDALLMPRNIDIRDYKDGQMQNGVNSRWITSNGVNPYWSAYNRLNEDKKDRFIISGYLKYQFNDWLSADVRVGTDFYSLNAEAKTWSGSRMNNSYNVSQEKFYENNYITSLTAKKDNIVGKWGASLSVYGQMMESKTDALYISASKLAIPNLFNINNSDGNPFINPVKLNKKINSVFAAAEINYDGFWFINATARNDWSSTLSVENRSYFYPSISTSLVVTDMINKLGGGKSKILSFAKLRASYAVTGNSLEPYELYNTYSIGRDPNGNIIASRLKILYDSNLKNELLKTFEFGADIKLFNRVSIDFSYYNTKSKNQLINLPMNPLSGYNAKKINAGEIQNTGFEVVLNSDIINNGNFAWNMNVNYSQNKNTINALYEDLSIYELGGFSDITVNALVGSRYGAIFGYKFKRVNDVNSQYNGKMILDGNGLPLAEQSTSYLGDQTPRALVGLNNSFSYKNFGLSFQIDGRFGGEFFSGTQAALQKSGLAEITAPGGRRDKFIVDGVVADGSGYKVNTTETTQQRYWTAVGSLGNSNLGITEQNVYDATNIRLRNVQISYNFPKSMFENSVIKSAKVSVSANNVWMIYSKAKGVDPESVFALSSNAVGFENFALPTSRSYFFNLTLGF
ncbi:SusC/RagA family TonB-linked outer membrane protein [Elizabethkingia anophelis]|nr:SusC/RagA family TonB-linked outer membrane protein [Elizabethkingia anophelis]MCT3697218.1 SusC/RagA family TonB-linked outer membrane protein [Elizabethkingia anophelis]MCT3861170.1 SusC/RagA family TonB-linked outer membrane protein [Elizabethkingia anophelis]MCT3914417.1 SusC/RagA family TonB-linked outer membrane protein [Elizabethkingia anophelis]MCT4313506.1 SusC/RagA family TonB-linked outer membrane protein [Elizabethkingia anophelis]